MKTRLIAVIVVLAIGYFGLQWAVDQAIGTCYRKGNPPTAFGDCG